MTENSGFKLQGKVVLITGGGGGFGRALSHAFAGAGATVLITDISDHGQVVANEVGGAFFQADISDTKNTHALFEKCVKDVGNIDILVNNAGLQHISPLEDFPEQNWIKLVHIMLIAPFQLTKYVIPAMKIQRWGRIINLSSIHGLVASPFKSAYVSAKHGLVGLTRTAALELGEFGITVNAICPGYSNTSLTKNQIAKQARVRGISENDVVEKVLMEPAAIKNLIEPDEIASLALFLASDDARSITGAALSIDSGWTAR
jgi:3-hydroxybutyrate dehydrogenase